MSYVLSNTNDSETYIKYFSFTNYFTKSNKNYKIIKYNKELLAVDLINIYTLIRSVLLIIFISFPRLIYILFRRIVHILILIIYSFTDKNLPCALKMQKGVKR